MKRAALLWTVFAVAGLAFAVGIGIAAGSIASERIGLSSEPLTAGEGLAPEPLRRSQQPDQRVRTTETTETRTTPEKTTPAPQPQPATPPASPPTRDRDDYEDEYESEYEPDDDD